MATQREHVALTYDDYLQLPEDRNRYELLEGELAVTPAPGTVHQRVVKNLLFVLEGHVRRRDLGIVLVAPTDVLLSDTTVVQPDLLYVDRAREGIIRPQYVQGAPDLVIEVISPATAKRDRQTKLKLYARYGVPNYWMFDPARREARASILGEDGYRQVVLARGSDVFTAPPFPDLAIPLPEIWRY